MDSQTVRAYSFTNQVTFIRASFLTGNVTAKESARTRMAAVMKVSMQTMKLKASEFISLRMVTFTKDNGMLATFMVKVLR